MKKPFKSIVMLSSLKAITAFVIIVNTLSSCKKDKDDVTTTPPSTDINYPAAFVINGGGNSISIINLNTEAVSRTINLNMAMYPHHVYQNAAKTQIAVAVPGMDLSAGHNVNTTGMTGEFRVLDAVTGSILKTQSLPMMNHNAVFSLDGTEIWTSQMDSMGTVLVYDAVNYTLKNTIPVGMMPAEVTFSSDGSMAFVANGMDNTVSAINPSTKSVMSTIPVGMEPVGAWVGSNNKMYVDNEGGQSITVIDVMTMAVTDSINLGFMPGMASYNGTMNELWVSDPDNGKVHWWTWDAGMNMYMHGGALATGAGAHAIAFNGMKAYITNQMAATVSVVDVMSHSKTKDITVGNKPNGIVIKN